MFFPVSPAGSLAGQEEFLENARLKGEVSALAWLDLPWGPAQLSHILQQQLGTSSLLLDSGYCCYVLPHVLEDSASVVTQSPEAHRITSSGAQCTSV